MTTIKLKNGSGAPTAGDLAQGEPALDLTNKRLYTENASGDVIEVGTNPTSVTTGDITATGTATFTGLATTANVTFGDNDKAIFGAGSDLQIYHDGSASYIKDLGTGPLAINTNGSEIMLTGQSGSEYMIRAIQDGAVELFHDANKKLATTSTGIDVTGTVTADGLTVDGDGATVASVNATTGTGVVGLRVNNTGGSTFLGISNSAGGGYLASIGNYATALVTESATNLALGTNNAKRLLIGSGGDISFYEDTGTTAKFQWFAAEEQLQITTGSTGAGGWSENLYLKAANYPSLRFWETTSGDVSSIGNNGDGSLYFSVGGTTGVLGTTAMVIDSSGNLLHGITGVPTGVLLGKQLVSSSPTGSEIIAFREDSSVAVGDKAGAFLIGNSDTDGAEDHFVGMWGKVSSTNGSQNLHFAAGRSGYEGDSSQMTLDSSGNLLVGKTSLYSTDQGIHLDPDGTVYGTRPNNASGVFNRKTSDGNIVIFEKDGTTTVGSIGCYSGDLTIGNGSTVGLIFEQTGSDRISPWNLTTNATRDGEIDLGDSNQRFKDIYASNGTIQTSDRNEKQDIEELSDAEQRVAVAAKGLLRKFRWIDSVEDKGDEARIHFGIIAQDLQDAFTAEGLDAGRYAMFINSTWTDEETGEERSRMGVRYSELLAFIIAAI